jgi:hypothetical protein
MPDLCDDALPGSACTPFRHDPRCRYAGTEPIILILANRQRVLMDRLADEQERTDAE